MHPVYRGQGLGYMFREKFQKSIIEPNIGLKEKVENTQLEPWPFILGGTCGYVHIENMASRKLLSKLRHSPVDLLYAPYLGGEKALQIFYVSHPEYFPPTKLPRNIIEMISMDKKELNKKIINIGVEWVLKRKTTF